MKTKKLASDAVLGAMCAVLGAISLDMGSIKITFESLPVLIAAFMFGPLDGMAVGGIGTLIYQLLKYGVTITTPLWILPYVLCGLFVGMYAKKYSFNLSWKQSSAAIFLSGFMVLLLNTLSLYIDSRIFGYYTPAFIYGALVPRIIIWLLKAAVFSAFLPGLIKTLKKAEHI